MGGNAIPMGTVSVVEGVWAVVVDVMGEKKSIHVRKRIMRRIFLDIGILYLILRYVDLEWILLSCARGRGMIHCRG